MARILHVAQPTEAGVARCVAQLAAAQRRDGHDVSVACPDDGTLPGDLAAAGVPALTWRAVRDPGPSVPGEVVRLGRLIGRTRPELVHLHSAKAGLAGRLSLRGRLPTVFQPHAWSFDAVAGPAGRAAVVWERQARRWTHLLVDVSEAERLRGQERGVLPRRTVVVPNGVDLEQFRPLDRSAARQRLGLGPEPLVVCVGRLARQKGQALAVRAWPEVRRRAPGARLALVGAGPDLAALEAAAGDGVLLAGPSRAVADWYAAADVVVVPSLWEGMALTPLEAMASARSVVAADVTGVRESLPPGAGAVVPAGDVAALAAALADRLDGTVPPDAEGRAGRAHVTAHHDLATTTRAVTTAALALL